MTTWELLIISSERYYALRAIQSRLIQNRTCVRGRFGNKNDLQLHCGTELMHPCNEINAFVKFSFFIFDNSRLTKTLTCSRQLF